MGTVNFGERSKLKIKGEISLYTSDGVTQKHLATFHNERTDNFLAVIKSVLTASNPQSCGITIISLGSGGDLDPVTHTPTSARQVPVSSETEMRRKIADIKIGSIEDVSTAVDSVTFKYVAIAQPHEAVSNIIDEFGLFTEDGVMIAHAVSPLDGLIAKKYTKEQFEFLVIKWQQEISI